MLVKTNYFIKGKAINKQDLCKGSLEQELLRNQRKVILKTILIHLKIMLIQKVFLAKEIFKDSMKFWILQAKNQYNRNQF